MKSDLINIGSDEIIKSAIDKVIGDVEEWLDTRRLGTVCVHGDYTFSNLLFDSEKNVQRL